MQTLKTSRLPEALEQWALNPWPMRDLSTARVDSHILSGGIHFIGIRHEVLQDVTSSMLDWWHRFFCYQQFEDSHGSQYSGFSLWHPEDHVACKVERHSLSGELGLAKGALIDYEEKYGNSLPIQRSAKVLRLDQQGFHISFRIFRHIYGLQMDDVTETAKGIEVSTRLVLETKGFIHEASESDDAELIETLKRAWIRHKVEEAGNLERILPCLFRQSAVRWFGNTKQ